MKVFKLVCMASLLTNMLNVHANPTQVLVKQSEFTRAYPITHITQEAIDAQHQALVQEFKLNTLARYGVKAATAALIVYLAYEVWASRRPQHDYGVQIPAAALAELDNAQLTSGLQAVQNHLQALDPQWLSWQWFKNQGKSIVWGAVNIALAKGVFDRGERMIDAIMHDGDLDWFIKTHTKILETAVELAEYANTHDTPGASEREHTHHKEQIMHIYQSFMQQMTAMLGFMSYSKSRISDAQVRVNVHMLLEYFRVTCNECAQSITNALEQDGAVSPQVNKFSVELNRLIVAFKRLEREQIAQI